MYSGIIATEGLFDMSVYKSNRYLTHFGVMRIIYSSILEIAIIQNFWDTQDILISFTVESYHD